MLVCPFSSRVVPPLVVRRCPIPPQHAALGAQTKSCRRSPSRPTTYAFARRRDAAAPRVNLLERARGPETDPQSRVKRKGSSRVGPSNASLKLSTVDCRTAIRWLPRFLRPRDPRRRNGACRLLQHRLKAAGHGRSALLSTSHYIMLTKCAPCRLRPREARLAIVLGGGGRYGRCSRSRKNQRLDPSVTVSADDKQVHDIGGILARAFGVPVRHRHHHDAPFHARTSADRSEAGPSPTRSAASSAGSIQRRQDLLRSPQRWRSTGRRHALAVVRSGTRRA